MTVEEKIGQLIQYTSPFRDSLPDAVILPGREEMIRQGRVGSFLNVHGAVQTRRLQEIAVRQSRLKIPILFGLDVIHGFRTIFPIPLAEASTWDAGVVENSAHIGAVEASAAGVHWTFAPMVDIARDPRWGRIAEGSGEDPFLGSILAAARVRGFQGTHPGDGTSVLACVKHFGAYGGAEAGRDYNTVDVSERTLREIYLPPYKAAVDAGAATVMCSFNEIAGIPSTENPWLLNDLLRKEWGFKGFVVSDWGSIAELQPHGVASSLKEAAALAFNAGTEMDMEGDAYRQHLSSLVREGVVSMGRLDEAVRRVLEVKASFGLFDDPFRYCNPGRESSLILQPSHLAAARDAGRQAIVLLKNEGKLLPLKKVPARIAVIGPLAASTLDPLGPWNGAGREQDVVSVFAGISARAGKDTRVLYARGCEIEGGGGEQISAAVDSARNADVVVLVLGESLAMSGEASSRSSIDLPGRQRELAEAVMATGKPVVLVLMNGRPLALPWAVEKVPSILETWFLGVQTGNAVADVLFGDYNPSGRLPVTFPRAVGQVPLYYNHKNTGRPSVDTSKFTSKYLDLPSTPLFPFGYGLSYTTFSYSSLTVSPAQTTTTGTVAVSVIVKNTGFIPGIETVQLYVRDDVASVTRPVRELKGFRKVSLAPGESRRVEFTLTPGQLAFYDRAMHLRVEPGDFTVYVGPNSAEGLEGRFALTSTSR
jgi:beta-glucosidase